MLRKFFSGSRKGIGVSVSAFGKHPGERDHFALNPSNSPRLTQVWETFYERGLKSIVPQWKQMPAEERVEQYRHVFSWQTEEGVVVGRMWSSRDGAQPPRKDFPLVVCVECRGLSLDWAVRNVLPYLEKVESRCKETDSIDVVGTIIRSAEGEIGRAAQEAGEDQRASRGVAVLSDAADLPGGTGERGFERVMYCLGRDLDVAPDRSGRRPSKKRLDRVVQLRVPRGERPAGEACSFWTEFVREFVAEGTAVLCVGSMEEGWVDVMAGPAQPGHLSCIRASTARTPMTSKVPYEIGADFSGACAALLAQGRKAAGREAGNAAGDASAPANRSEIEADRANPPHAAGIDPSAVKSEAPPAGPETATVAPPVSASVAPPFVTPSASPAIDSTIATLPPSVAPAPSALPVGTDERAAAPPVAPVVASRVEAPAAVAAPGRAKTPLVIAGVAVVMLGGVGWMLMGRGEKKAQVAPGESTDTASTTLVKAGDAPNTSAVTPASMTPEAATPTQAPDEIASSVAAASAAAKDPRAEWKVAEALAAAGKRLAELEARFGATEASLTEGVGALTRRAAYVREMAWGPETRGVIEREMGEVDARVRDLDGRLARAMEEQAASFKAWREQLGSSPSVGSPALDAAWKEIIKAALAEERPEFARRRDWAALQGAASKISSEIRAVDTGAGEGRWKAVYAEAAKVLYDEAVMRACGAVSVGRAGVAWEEKKIVDARDQYVAAMKRVEEQVAALVRVERLLDQLHLPAEKPGDGGASVVASWKSVGEIGAFESLAESAAKLRDRVRSVQAVESEQDVGKLLALARGEGSASPLVMRAAWSRVVGMRPTSDSFGREVEAGEKLRAALGAAGERGPALADAVGADVERRWGELFAVAKKPEELESLARLREQAGVTKESLADPRQRFNVALWELKSSGVGAADVERAVGEMESINLADSRALASALRSALRGEFVPGQPGDEAKGPGGVGWEREALAGDLRLRFVLTARGRTRVVEFVRVEPSAEMGTPFYLSADEVSVGLTMDLLEAFSDSESAQKWLKPGEWIDPVGAWGWRYERTFSVAPDWFDARKGPFARAGNGEPYEIPEVQATSSPPTAEHPMQQVTFDAAQYLAGLAKCRLPTAAEWLAAHRQHGEQERGKWNLRDRTFSRQYAAKRSPLPDTESFPWRSTTKAERVWDKTMAGPVEAEGEAAHHDETLWFRPANEPKEAALRNLVGNVAEYVKTDAKGGATAPDAAVVGGSAFSPPGTSESLIRPTALPRGDSGKKRFSDVGFRLAFTAPAESKEKRLKGLIAGASYVFAPG